MAQPSKGKNSKNTMKHLDKKTAGAASANDYTGLIPANPQKTDNSYEDLRPRPK